MITNKKIKDNKKLDLLLLQYIWIPEVSVSLGFLASLVSIGRLGAKKYPIFLVVNCYQRCHETDKFENIDFYKPIYWRLFNDFKGNYSR